MFQILKKKFVRFIFAFDVIFIFIFIFKYCPFLLQLVHRRHLVRTPYNRLQKKLDNLARTIVLFFSQSLFAYISLQYIYVRVQYTTYTKKLIILPKTKLQLQWHRIDEENTCSFYQCNKTIAHATASAFSSINRRDNNIKPQPQTAVASTEKRDNKAAAAVS